MNAVTTPTVSIPAIGTHSSDGTMIYAGIARGVDGQRDYQLWLIAAQPANEINWADAMKWAAELGDGAALPTRREQAILYAQLPEHFATDWYWSGEQYAGFDEYAWCQHFDFGLQYGGHKSSELRVRAVRRLPIQ